MLRVINPISGASLCSVPLNDAMTAFDLKCDVERCAGTPRCGQRLLLEGRLLQDGELLRDAVAQAGFETQPVGHADVVAEIASVSVSFDHREQRKKEDAAACFARLANRGDSGQALCKAAASSDFDAISGLLRKDPGLVFSTAEGRAPLHYAANDNICVQLLRARANPNVQDKQDCTPLHRAAREGHGGMVKLLLSAGARVVATNKSSKTPLHLSQSRVVTEALVLARADIGAQDKHGNTPLHIIDDCESARVLLGARAEPNSCNVHGNTPLHLAMSSDIVEALLSARADVNKSGEMLMTPREMPAAVDILQDTLGTSLRIVALVQAQALRNATLPAFSKDRPTSRQTPRTGSKRRTARQSISRR